MRVKKLIKMGLSEGRGVQLDFPLNQEGGGVGWLIMNAVAKKSIVLACVS